jgi:hypothetical protein
MPKGAIVDAGGLCCSEFDGYHDEAAAGAAAVPYAVVCSCPGLDGPSVTDLQQITVAAAHELVEAATDPRVQTYPAFGQNDDADVIWTLTTGGEVADMCEFNRNAYAIPSGSKYMVQQSWSNAAAKAGKDPCLPAQPGPYFNAIGVLPDTLSISGVPFNTKGVKLKVGESKTIDVKLFSEGPTSKPISVKAIDYSYAVGGSSTLDLKLDKTSGMNGDTLKLTIKMLSLDSTTGADAFFLEADIDGQSNLWMGAVGN